MLKISLLASVATIGLTSCNNNSPAAKEEKVEEAKQEVMDAQEELAQAVYDSTTEYGKYKTETEALLIANDKRIAEFKMEMKEEKKEAREAYEKQLSELEKTNADLKMEIKEFKEGEKGNWQTFKEGFNKKLDNLGKSISALSKKNKDKK